MSLTFPSMLPMGSNCYTNVQTQRVLNHQKGEVIQAATVGQVNGKTQLFVVTYMEKVKINQLYLMESGSTSQQSAMIPSCKNVPILDITIFDQQLFALTTEGVYKYAIDTTNGVTVFHKATYTYSGAKKLCVATSDQFGLINRSANMNNPFYQRPVQGEVSLYNLSANSISNCVLHPLKGIVLSPIDLTYVNGSYWLTCYINNIVARKSEGTVLYKINSQGECLKSTSLSGFYDSLMPISEYQLLIGGNDGCMIVDTTTNSIQSRINNPGSISSCVVDNCLVISTAHSLNIRSLMEQQTIQLPYSRSGRVVSKLEVASHYLTGSKFLLRLMATSNTTIYGVNETSVFKFSLHAKG